MKTSTYILLVSIVVIFCGCKSSPDADNLINTKASLPSSFNFNSLGLKVMASFVNKSQASMSTQPGEFFALITWKQQADKNWFGANIPGELQSVELLRISTTNIINYMRYKGAGLVLDTDTLIPKKRIAFILSQQPSVMP
jgi:hypothetical protein